MSLLSCTLSTLY